ncbi:MAG: hypothetical protein ACOYT7_02085 [Patescibacteria group bacterium]
MVAKNPVEIIGARYNRIWGGHEYDVVFAGRYNGIINSTLNVEFDKTKIV